MTDDRFYSIIKKIAIGFLIACIITVLVLSVIVSVNVETINFITIIEPMEETTIRSTKQGSGVLIERNGGTVRLKNTGTYDVLPGLGMIVDHFIENYPIISINQTFIDISLNISTICINTTILINETNTLTSDSSLIMTQNPWKPSLASSNIQVNETYIKSNLNLNTLSSSGAIIMSPNSPWNPTNGNAILTLNQTYINANLNLSTLNQGNGIIMTSSSWNPSGSASTISVDETYINNNLNLGFLTATNGLTMTPNPWNPATNGNAIIQVTQNFDQQGFMAVWIRNTVNITGVITGNWSTSVAPAWTDGGFNITGGFYTAPSSGIYSVDSRLFLDTATTTIALRVNFVSTYLFFNVVDTSGSYILTASIPLNAGDIVDIFASSTRTVNGGPSGLIPWTTFFGLNKIST